MTNIKQTFNTADILSVLTGYLLSSSYEDAVEVLKFVSQTTFIDKTPSSLQIDTIRETILEQHPILNSKEVNKELESLSISLKVCYGSDVSIMINEWLTNQIYPVVGKTLELKAGVDN